MNGHPGVSNVFTWWNHHRSKSSGTSLPCLTEVTGTGCLIFCFQLLNVHLIQSISTYLSFFFLSLLHREEWDDTWTVNSSYKVESFYFICSCKVRLFSHSSVPGNRNIQRLLYRHQMLEVPVWFSVGRLLVRGRALHTRACVLYLCPVTKLFVVFVN